MLECIATHEIESSLREKSSTSSSQKPTWGRAALSQACRETQDSARAGGIDDEHYNTNKCRSVPPSASLSCLFRAAG